ncbi:hypothetical protein [Fodinibius salsisoli]|uniref:Peptidase M50B-like n=1 Tax=Fodinibius salsisoli TaxID=2820877 RepID=A0ABT3PQX9_9BACT|nr:hypothetical protein [Fodinibius salsisoli]MCW9708277.1 hypothetical protein [Fodinibius salsisoli]
MDTPKLKNSAVDLLKKWWCSLFILPFIAFSIHQIYLALNYNIFFAVNYDYPFPLGVIHLFIDNFLLIVHEAGHTFFSILGVRFITILGGSLFQILLPLMILSYFWVNHQKIGIQLSLCLVGYSWLDVACYAADGSARQLPLIGGLGAKSHDWYNLLHQVNALEHDITFGVIFSVLGILCYTAALSYPLFFKRYKTISLDLNL